MRILGGLGLGLLLILGVRRREPCIAGLWRYLQLADECFCRVGHAGTGRRLRTDLRSQVEYVGVDCLNAISATIACLGTCDVESLTQEQALACQDEALGIESACE